MQELAKRHVDSQRRKKRRRIEETIAEARTTALTYLQQTGDALAKHWEDGVGEYVERAAAASASAERVLQEIEAEQTEFAAQQEVLVNRLAEEAEKFESLHKRLDELPARWAQEAAELEQRLHKTGDDAAATLGKSVKAARRKMKKEEDNEAGSLGQLLLLLLQREALSTACEIIGEIIADAAGYPYYYSTTVSYWCVSAAVLELAHAAVNSVKQQKQQQQRALM
eukprot:4574-Heterococcus_DN1.PRE.3